MPPVLHTVICSTRPTRVGPSVANWFATAAQAHGGFDARLIDLADMNLPLFDEPEHPMRRNYQHEHTRRWSASVSEADAFVFVTPEYNYGPPPSLLNALNYLYHEWTYKPAGFVSYGGIGGGMRAVQMEKLTLTTLKMMPMVDNVAIPWVAKQIDDDRRFTANESQQRSATGLLDELLRWALALQGLRANLPR